MAEPRKKCFEIVFDNFKGLSEDILNQVPELRSVIVIADWEVGANDFPAGLAVSRESDPPTAEMFFARQRQLMKVQATQMDKLSQLLQLYQRRLMELEEKQGESENGVKKNPMELSK